MKEIFMISQLITRLSKTTKLEKYQQDKVIAYFEKKHRLIAADLSKKKHYMLIREQFNILILLAKQNQQYHIQ